VKRLSQRLAQGDLAIHEKRNGDRIGEMSVFHFLDMPTFADEKELS
jgi:hypothetical protein